MNRSGKKFKKGQSEKKTQQGNDGKRRIKLKPQGREKYKQFLFEE